MATHKYTLGNLPNNPEDQELWLQHVAGFIIFEDARNYAIEQIPPDTNSKTREKIISGIDQAIYGMMMIFDGASGKLENDKHQITLSTLVNLSSKGERSIETIKEVKLAEGDGMCTGFHSWREGDFGKNPVTNSETD